MTLTDEVTAQQEYPYYRENTSTPEVLLPAFARTS